MKQYTTSEFKKDRLEVENILHTYQVHKFKLENLLNYLDKEPNAKELEKLKTKINLVDLILSKLKPENKKILIDVFIKKTKSWMCYWSIATYYRKIKAAIIEFLDYFR